MARNLSSQPGVDNTDVEYLNGKLVNGGTRAGEGINQDIVQFFQKLMNNAGLAANGDPDNEAKGYQFIEALEDYINSVSYSKAETQSLLIGGEVSIGGIVTRLIGGVPITVNKLGTGSFEIVHNFGNKNYTVYCTAVVTTLNLNSYAFKIEGDNTSGASNLENRVGISIKRLPFDGSAHVIDDVPFQFHIVRAI